MKCPKCGKRTPDVLDSCKHCGKRLPYKKREGQATPPRLTALHQRQLLIAGAVGLCILVALLILILSPGEKGKEARLSDQKIYIETGTEGREIASNAVMGKVVALRLRENRRGEIAVRSLQTRKDYTFSVGWRTSYHPGRYPVIGEQVTIYYLLDKGLMEATQVVIGEGAIQ
jgi:hypothetical protein